MNQVRRYLFWIVCGGLLLVELILFLVLEPTNAEGKTPEEVKLALDNQYKQLGQLYARANHTLTGVYNTEDPKDIEKLTGYYIINNKWGPVLNSQVDIYRKQLSGIRADLIDRSTVLHKEVAASGDLRAWYTSYKEQSDALVAQLAKRGQLSGVAAGGDISDRLRDQVGLFTKSADFPQASEHAQITSRFRSLQAIYAALATAKADVLPNPILHPGDKSAMSDIRPMVSSATWTAHTDVKPMLGPTGRYATAEDLVLSLQGPESSLEAAIARIEDIQRPVLVVTGVKLGEIHTAAPGSRKDVPFVPAECEISLVVLDYTPLTHVDLVHEAESQPATGQQAPRGPHKGPSGPRRTR